MTKDGGTAGVGAAAAGCGKLGRVSPEAVHAEALVQGPNFDEYKELSIGMRDFHAQGATLFSTAGRQLPRHSRRRLSLTGYPPTDVTYRTKLFETRRAWGELHAASFVVPARGCLWRPINWAYLQLDQYVERISPGTPMEKCFTKS